MDADNIFLIQYPKVLHQKNNICIQCLPIYYICVINFFKMEYDLQKQLCFPVRKDNLWPITCMSLHSHLCLCFSIRFIHSLPYVLLRANNQHNKWKGIWKVNLQRLISLQLLWKISLRSSYYLFYSLMLSGFAKSPFLYQARDSD